MGKENMPAGSDSPVHPNEEQNERSGILTAGKHISYWTDSIQPLSYSPLLENTETDVVIVGGGISGICLAYCLTNSGQNVVLVEDGVIGSGESGRTSAHLTTALDERYFELEDIFGKEQTKLIGQSHIAAIDFIEQTSQKEKIDCEFKRVEGYLFLHPSADDREELKKEWAAALRSGIDVNMMDHTPGMLTNNAALQFMQQAKFHPLKFVTGLCKAAVKHGARVYTQTHAEKISHEGITTDKGFTVTAKHVVIATNSPVNNLVAMHLKQNGFRTYIIGALVKKGTLPDALWWDSGDMIKDKENAPYHYVRLTTYDDQHDLLLSGGEDHAVGDTTTGGVSEKKRYNALEEWTRRHFPIGEVVYHWSGEVMNTIDHIAFIGRNPFDKDNVYIVTGDCGDGLTYGPIAGMLITDLINGKENAWEKIYKPTRLTFKKLNAFFKGLMQGIVPPKTKTSNEVHAKDEVITIKAGEAKLIELNGEKCGVYRDHESHLHVVSAKCTHLGCTVCWNDDELSWDCPCHGSRFTYEGKVIHGPANNDLPSYTYTDLENQPDSIK